MKTPETANSHITGVVGVMGMFWAIREGAWFTAGCRRGRTAEREDRAEVRRRQRGDD